MLTNAKTTNLYRVADAEPLLSLKFDDFAAGNDLYEAFVQRMRVDAFTAASSFDAGVELLYFTKPGIPEVNAVFAKCHQRIYESDHISQAAGFVEFVKLITLKLLSDKKIRDTYPGLVAERRFEHPADEVEFSVRWINTQSTGNPVNSILFRDFMDDVETQIAKKIRKRFFDEGEEIKLKPETIKAVVRLLEDRYLFGIDADLNGRLFENLPECHHERQGSRPVLHATYARETGRGARQPQADRSGAGRVLRHWRVPDRRDGRYVGQGQPQPVPVR